jgi:tetratricopeptide (TPR) repeat protein
MAMSLDTLRKLVKLDPNDPLSRYAIGKKLYELSQDLPEAADHLRFAHAKDPSHLATYFILSKVLIALGHRDEARALLKDGIGRVASVGEGMGRDLGPAMQQMLADLDQPPQLQAEIRLARPDEIIDLRHRVLRVGLPRSEAIFPGDDAPTTRHAVAVVQGQVACCATVMLQSVPEDILGLSGRPAFRLRGMATDEQHRGHRLGQRVLSLLESESQKVQPTRLLWCNARIGAVRFYREQGWGVVSREPYDIPTAGLHHTMIKQLLYSVSVRRITE